MKSNPRHFVFCLASVACFSWFTLTTIAAERTHAIVPGYERFFTKPDADLARGGLLLLSELNCTACHEGPADEAYLAAKKGPRLDELGGRIRVEHLRQYLADPQKAKPGTTMPKLFVEKPDSQREQNVEALVHFLASSAHVIDAPAIKSAVRRGEQLFHRVGCVACHDARRKPATEFATSVPLPKFSDKYSIPGLAKFLEDPLSIRPAGRMPDLNLTGDEARDIASYLLQDLEVPARMTFKYYEGDWDKLPDFEQLTIKEQGPAASFDVKIDKSDSFAVRFEGSFRVDRAGEYRFRLGSDDGSKLTIDGQVVVDNDGIHAMKYETGRVQLTEGVHAFVLDYFEQAGGEELAVEFSGPGQNHRALEFALVGRDEPATKPELEPDPKLVEQGRQLFQSTGCAACHHVQVDGKPLAANAAKKLIELNSDQGCLSLTPPTSLPRYAFSDPQRRSIAAALETLRNKQSGSTVFNPADELVHTMTTLNCYACHERGNLGGPEEARNKFFLTNQPEMGDEGRIPPALDGVGDKLRSEALQRTIERGAKDRTYMYTRMPGFGERNIGRLPATLSQIDRETAMPTEPDPSFDRKVKSAGRQLVGEKGMSCIKCHTWGNSKASGIQAISLTTMTKRLRSDWFHRYLLDPQKYRRGTRMPAAWPGGQSPFAKILDGDALKQIHAIWVYLEDSDSANPPVGLINNPIELVPTSEPIVYRNFLDGAGPRGIAVGYPEHVNLAYDAENCRLALLWQGAFIDASMHWTGRGSGFQKPMGDNLLLLPAGVPLFSLNSMQESWPRNMARELGYQFGGYRLDAKRRPIVQFRWNEARVEESFEPIVGNQEMTLRRTLLFTSTPVNECYLRAMVADKIEAAGERTYRIDGDWHLLILSPPAQPIVRKSESKQEILIPLSGSDKAENLNVVLEYRW